MVVNWVRFCSLCQWQDPPAAGAGGTAMWTPFAMLAARFLQWQWSAYRLRVLHPAGVPPEDWWHDWAQLIQRVHVWWGSKNCGSLVPGPLHTGPPTVVRGDTSAPHPFRRGWCLLLRSTPGDLHQNVDPLEARPYWNWPRGRTAAVPAHRLAAPWTDMGGAAQALAGNPTAAADGAEDGDGPVNRRQMHAWRGLWAAWRRGPFWEGAEGAHPQRGRTVCEECHRVPLLCPCRHGAPPEPWHWLRFGAHEHDEEGAVVCRRCRLQQPRNRRGGLWLTACSLGVPQHSDHPGWVSRVSHVPEE